MTLTSKEKQQLKARAHHLDPQIQIGKQGVTPEQIQTIKTHLKSHELLKIKFNDHKRQKEELSKQITEQTESQQVNLIGNTLIIYKKHTQ
jgi:RNA-binding protein